MRLRTASVLVAWLVASILTGGSRAAARGNASLSTADRVVATYYRILNAGLQTGDFSALAQAYAPDVTLKRSTLQGNATVYHGLTQLNSFYHATFLKAPGMIFKIVSIRDLTPTIVLTYDDAFLKGAKQPARCAHVFVLGHGRIVTHDWINYQAAS